MTEVDLAADQLAAVAVRRDKLRKAVIVAAAFSLLVVAVGTGWMIFDPAARHFAAPDFVLPGGLAVIVLAAASFAWRRFSPPPGADHPEILARRAERMQARRARALRVFPFCLLVLAPSSVWSVQEIRAHGYAPGVFTLGAIALLCALYLALITGRFVDLRARLEDELSLSHRRSAIEAGFWTGLVLGAADVAIGFARPDWVLPGLIVSLMAAVGAVSATFAILDARAMGEG
ncbi:MAG: hypothetical protein ACRED9_07170 [Caulobacteraceae bacterium]